ncbi:MAG: polysaccharide biosynthesis protein [Bdellovibrio sp.]|nr:polysaccharide biosynthesis protein [Bdellovibrio sp.]
MYTQLARLPRKIKLLIMIICDVILLPLALWSAIALRYGTIHPDVSTYWWVFILVPFITVPIFVRFGLYRAVVRYVDEKVLYTVFYGVSLSVLLLTAAILLGGVIGLPRSSILIYWIISVAYITASRYLGRSLLRSLEKRQRKRVKVAIYGAGRAGLQTAMALLSGSEYSPVLFFDDSKDLQGSSLLGIRVYDPRLALSLMSDYGCEQLLLAMPSASRSRRKEIIQSFESSGVQLKTIPGMGDLVGGTVKIEDIREVGVEDLLGRDAVPPFENLLGRCIREKTVLVTGAGGSIGSELCRQIVKAAPKKIILLEQSEFALYKLEQELSNEIEASKLVPVLGSVLDQVAVSEVISSHKVQTIYHAAAYKHVPLVEANVTAGVMNNAFGTLSVANLAAKHGVETFVLISTDKAVRPTNVMGASKRFAEMILQAMQAAKGFQTRFCMVRFGNVLGSSGSVVPLFKEQIRKGGPVTVTHPDITRFFMTIPEAAQLVLQAGAMGTGGDVFVLDMGESVKIVDLAKKMIELSGFTVRDPATGAGDIAIEFVGMRPGEKLYEELLIGDNVSPTEHPRIMRAEESYLEFAQLEKYLIELRSLCEAGESLKVRALLHKLIPEFKTSSDK